MSEIVTTTGCRMSRVLQDSIDNMPATTRQAVIAAYTEPSDSELALLRRAIVLELQLAELRDADMFSHLGADLRADIPDGPPFPPQTGKPAWYDPNTGTFSEEPPDNCT
jgi:hypothetical protein